MVLLSLYPVCRALSAALLALFSVITLCAGQGLCCVQFGSGKADACHYTADDHGGNTADTGSSCCSESGGESHADSEEPPDVPETSCCSTTPVGSDHSRTAHTSHDCSACSLCSQCGASIISGLAFLSAELLPSGNSVYYPVLYLTVSAAYDITEPPPNCL